MTKRDILELFRDGMEVEELFDVKLVTYFYYGRLEELEFLSRLYDLNAMESYDSRYATAEGDIFQHTINNDDYPHCWVFEDERFQLKNGSDETYLKFLCEVFHPEVRIERGYWKEFLAEINSLLQHDGYEIYPAEKISNRDLYKWRIYQENEVFIPFSQRNKKAIKQKQIVLKIKRVTRNRIYELFERYDYRLEQMDETGLTYLVLVSDQVLYDIEKFYPPKTYIDNQFVETNSLEDFILYTSPYYLLDAVEFFDQYCDSNFTDEINTIFNLNDVPMKLSCGKVEYLVDSHIVNSSFASIQEVGIQELIQEAQSYYEKENLKIAVEKVWDAFERLKTYYSFQALDKKKSTNKIIEDMSGNKRAFKDLFEKEFRELTAIGNNFRIRHHETLKIDIEDYRHYDYLYKRCLTLIAIAVKYLENRIIS
nr:hypothetical protein [Gracilibacillus thailandensis]